MALISSGSGSDKLSAGTTAQRPTLTASEVGSLRYNTDNTEFEKWDGTQWAPLSASVEVGDTAPTNPTAGDLWWNSDDTSGRLFVYYEDANSSQWVEASPLGPDYDDTYLKVDASNGPVTGNLEISTGIDLNADGTASFTGLTTHEDGVSVTGGTSVTNGIIKDSGYLKINNEGETAIFFDDTNDNLGFFGSTPATAKVGGSNSEKRRGFVFSASTTDGTEGGTRPDQGFMAIQGQTALEPGKTVENISCFFAGTNDSTGEALVNNQYGYYASNVLRTAFNNYGFYTDLGESNHQGGDAYSFYAAGDAPNYFEGTIKSPGTYNNTSTSTNNTLRTNGSGLFSRSTSSRRYKDNIRDCSGFGSGSALDFVSQVQPRMWEDYSTGETVCGFIAEELFELGGEHLVSFSPWSREVTTDETNDDGEVIGTRTTRQYPFVGNGSTPATKDGGALTDDSEVVDGLNERGLVITLVKALQEAATKIDDLESRLSALES